MTERLQVLFSESEMAEIRRLAEGGQIPADKAEAKLKAIRLSAKYSFPTSDIDQMLREIEQGYRSLKGRPAL
jgi:hypothetical protein